MSALTTRLSLYKPGGGLTGSITPDEVADIDKLNDNFDDIDAAIGAHVCTSGTRPASPYNGQVIYETDTDKLLVWVQGTTSWDGLEVYPDVATLKSTVGRGTQTMFKVADIAALDALATAEIGDTAYMTTPGTGVGALTWTAYAGSGSGLDWRLADQVVIAATKANLDSFISAVSATSDLDFRDGTIAYVTATRFMYKITTDAGALDLQPSRIIPSSATNGSVDANGVVTSTAQSLVRVRDAFPSEFTVFEIVFDVDTTSTLDAYFASGATDQITDYDNQRLTSVSTTTASVQALNATAMALVPIGGTGRVTGRMTVFEPNVVDTTHWIGDFLKTPNPMTTSFGQARTSGQRRAAQSYNSFTLQQPSGNLTINSLIVRGLY